MAITFDDLPSQQGGSLDFQVQMNQKILTALKKNNIKSVGFVVASQLHADDTVLKMWINEGHDLGNHTFSHKLLSKTKLEDYQKDVIKGASIPKDLMEKAGRDFHFFRYPYLDAGTFSKKKKFEIFLQKQGYTIAPVTIDTEDWKFNQKLMRNTAHEENIKKAYLKHTKKILHQQSKQRKHIWLLHVNKITSECIEDLIKIAKDEGCHFVDLEEVLEEQKFSKNNRHQNNLPHIRTHNDKPPNHHHTLQPTMS